MRRYENYEEIKKFLIIIIPNLKMYSTILTTSPKITVDKNPPRNPSHVFLGDNLINLVLPKKKPREARL